MIQRQVVKEQVRVRLYRNMSLRSREGIVSTEAEVARIK